jgi:hypothetical protein
MDGDKVPLEKWKHLEYRTPLEIRRDSKFKMRCGVAILAGKSGLVVIDIDDEESWSQFVSGREIPRTLELSTHSGRQLVFSDKTGISYKTQGSQLAPGVDVRGRGGLFVVYDPGQPERHYTDLTEPALLPDWLATAIPRAGTRGRRKGTAGQRRSVSADDIKKLSGEVIPPGQHNDWLRSTALSLANQGWTKKNRNEWFMIASAALARSNEGSDAKGNVDRPHFSDEDIMAYFDTALDLKSSEDKKGPGNGYEDEDEEDFDDPDLDNFINADDVEVKSVEWLNDPFLPLGCLVILDGDPGHGKSSIVTGMVARSASGLPALPFGDPGPVADEEMNCGMITAEDDIERAVVPRLMAAGYMRNRRVWFMGLSKDRHGKIQQLTFPHGIARVRRFIEDNKLQLLTVDPISAFIGEDIHSHNEVSVRRALAPLAEVARETGCCVVLVRHLNKDGSMKAMYRGTGSIAFSAIARSGIITGTTEDGDMAIAQVKCSYSERFEGVIRYSLNRWEKNRSVVVVEWGDIDTDVTADDIAGGKKSKHGPAATKQEEIRALLAPMFDEKDTWSKKDILQAIEDEGITASEPTINKTLKSMGLRPIQVFQSDGKIGQWSWTKRKIDGNTAVLRMQPQ